MSTGYEYKRRFYPRENCHFLNVVFIIELYLFLDLKFTILALSKTFCLPNENLN